MAEKHLAVIQNEHSPSLGTVSTSTKEKLGWKLRCRVIWSACPSCGREKWVPLKMDGSMCNPCSVRLKTQPKGAAAKKPGAGAKQRGHLNHAWRGGRKKHQGGYRYVTITPDDPMWPMVGTNHNEHSGYVLEHRLVMARKIGRPLTDDETVHHRNGHRADNRIENLELWFGNHGKGQRAHEYHCPGCRCFEGERGHE